jgi:hypothetical protein
MASRLFMMKALFRKKEPGLKNNKRHRAVLYSINANARGTQRLMSYISCEDNISCATSNKASERINHKKVRGQSRVDLGISA